MSTVKDGRVDNNWGMNGNFNDPESNWTFAGGGFSNKNALNGNTNWGSTKPTPPALPPRPVKLPKPPIPTRSIKPSVTNNPTPSSIQKQTPLRYTDITRNEKVMKEKGLRPQLGVTRSGWGKPVPLLGLTKKEQQQMKSTFQSKGISKNVVKNMTAFKKRTVPGASIPGRFFSDQAVWFAASQAQQELQKYRLDPEDPNWEIASQVGSIVSTGLSYINPILGAVAGPLVEGIAQLAKQGAKNNIFEGGYSFGSNEDQANFKTYAAYVEQLGKEGYSPVTFDEWNKYNEEMKVYNNAGGSCQIITPDMLGDLTVEEYMKQNGIAQSGPAPTPPRGPKIRDITPDEQAALDKGITLMS